MLMKAIPRETGPPKLKPMYRSIMKLCTPANASRKRGTKSAA